MWLIVSLCCQGTQTSLQIRVLKDFVHILHISENRTTFLQQPYWQYWLLAILASNPNHTRSVAERTIMNVIVEMFVLLFHHSLHHSGGWKAITDTQALLTYFSSQGFLEYVTPHLDCAI
jgi:hypothetical protein